MYTFIFIILVAGFVDDGAVLETPKVEHPHAAVCPTAYEDVDTASAEPYVEDLFVVSNELCLCRQSRYIPDCACRVDARSNYKLW